MTDALAALGVIALVASGQFSRTVSAIVLVGLAIALSVRESWQRHPWFRHVDSGLLVVVLGVQVCRLVFDASVVDVLVEFAAALQIIRVATRKGAAHDQQIILLALLHLITGTVLGGGLGYGICLFGVLIVTPGALVLSHLRREVEGNYRQGARDRTGLPVDVPRILRSRRVVGRWFLVVTCLISIPIFLFTAILFIAFPRVGVSLLLLNHNRVGRMIGFSGRVDLGEVGMLRSDPALALRVEISDLPEPPPPRLTLHLRGTALDQYDGRTWSQSDSTKRPVAHDGGLLGLDGDRPPVLDGPRMTIDLLPIDPPVLFLPPNATALRLHIPRHLGPDPGVLAFRGAEDEVRYQPTDDRGLKYEVFLSPPNKSSAMALDPRERVRYLVVPSDMPARVRDLAEKWTAGAPSPLQKTQLVERHLRTEYRYDLASPSPRDPQPLDHFLFESKRGHCEFYSTAMAMLLRTVGVPTRNVTGFIGGSYNRFGRFYAVRQGDAHSWVEVWIDGEGWRTFDPTPPADAAPRTELSGALAYVRDLLEATSQRWDRHVVGYDLGQQHGLWSRLTSRYRQRDRDARSGVGAVAILAMGLTVAGVGVWLSRRRRGRSGTEPGLVASARSPSAVRATALYELLEGAMSAQGVPRATGMPPLRHAETLRQLAHPVADEIFDLTEIYLQARFGGLVLDEGDREQIEVRIKALRTRRRRDMAVVEDPAA